MQQQPAYTKRVHCFSNTSLSKNFVNPSEAIDYANLLLRDGEKAKLYDYKPPVAHVDRVVERYPDGPPWLRK